MEQGARRVVEVIMMMIPVRLVVVALVIAVSLIAWRGREVCHRVGGLEQTVDVATSDIERLRGANRALYRHEEESLKRSFEVNEDNDAVDRAQTAFALGQYENAIEIATNVLNRNRRREVIPTRLWRIVLASTCALKQAARARAYALNPEAEAATGDQLVVYFCTKNHISFPSRLIDSESIAE